MSSKRVSSETKKLAEELAESLAKKLAMRSPSGRLGWTPCSPASAFKSCGDFQCGSGFQCESSFDCSSKFKVGFKAR